MESIAETLLAKRTVCLRCFVSSVGSHLQDAHPKGVAQHLVCVCVVAVANRGGGYKHRKRVVFLRVHEAVLHALLDLLHALLLVAARRERSPRHPLDGLICS